MPVADGYPFKTKKFEVTTFLTKNDLKDANSILLISDREKHFSPDDLDSINKTIYYDNAVLKVYDFPIFYFPKLSHPDPTVKRRSGFLVPSFSNSSNIGFGVNVPYFWDIAKDKDITFTPRILPRNETLYLAEYRQDFINSSLILRISKSTIPPMIN